MTLIDIPPVRIVTPPPAARVRPARTVLSTAVTILSASLLGFAIYVGFLSQFHYDRAQRAAYANFRVQLAQATAPTGQTVPGSPKKLLSLGTPVAVLSIPSLHLRTVVFEGTTATVLQNGPGHLRDTPLPGQVGTSEILGRAFTYGGPFGALSSLQPGATITVTTGLGTSTFSVLDLRRAGDPQPDPVAAGHGRLILTTADGSRFVPSGVLRVDADLTSAAQPSVPLVIGQSQLLPSEQSMAIDSTAWYALVLWGEALLLATVLLAWVRTRWGGWQIWIVAVPVIGFVGLAVADQATRLLPNLM
ncbi:MAG TPA: class E sortase [Micromonosporaceae bacterium]